MQGKRGETRGALYWSREVREVWDSRSYPLPSTCLDGLLKILAVSYVQISLSKIMQTYSFETLKTYFLKVLCRKAVLNT